MDQSVTCPIHKDDFEDPVSLTCGHTFCKNCLVPLIQNKQLKCPNCRTIQPMPEGKDSLKVNILMRNMLQQFKAVSINSEEKGIREMIMKTYDSSNTQITIDEVIPIKNDALEQRFFSKVNKIQGDKSIQTKLHGTYLNCVQKIQNEGFKIPSTFSRSDCSQEGELTFGKAIYLSSHTSKVVNYGDRVIIVCHLVLGRVKVKTSSDSSLDPTQASKQGFDTIYYQMESQKNPDFMKGSKTDEYAIYDSAQVLPKYVVKYRITDKKGEEGNLKYDPSLTVAKTDYQLLINVIQNGTESQVVIALRILGDLSCKENGKATEQILKYHMQFFQGIKTCLEKQDEQTLMHALRVLWNSSYHNRNIQEKSLDRIDPALFLRILQIKHVSVLERCAGVIQNLTEMEKANAILFQQKSTMEILLKLLEEEISSNRQNLLVIYIGAIANILKYVRFDENKSKQLLAKFDSFVSPLVDHPSQKVSEVAIRMISNQIGYGQDWEKNGYKPSQGLEALK